MTIQLLDRQSEQFEIVIADHDELLTKDELCARILLMDIKTAERHIISKAKFPYLKVGNRKRYPKKAVEKWIEENTHYV